MTFWLSGRGPSDYLSSHGTPCLFLDEGGAEEAAAGGEIESPADTGLETGVEETPPLDLGGEEGGGGEADLELASVDESGLPLILEKFDNNNKVDLGRGKSNLKEVSDQLESLLKD